VNTGVRAHGREERTRQHTVAAGVMVGSDSPPWERVGQVHLQEGNSEAPGADQASERFYAVRVLSGGITPYRPLAPVVMDDSR